MCTERELPTWWSWTSKPTKVSRPGASAQVVCRHVANSCWNPCAEIEDSGLVARNSVLIVKRVPSAWKGPRESKSAVCRICSIPGHLAVHCPHTGYVKRATQAVREGALSLRCTAGAIFRGPLLTLRRRFDLSFKKDAQSQPLFEMPRTVLSSFSRCSRG